MPNLAGYGKAASKHTKTAASHEVAIFVPFLKKAFKPNIKHIYYYALFYIRHFVGKTDRTIYIALSAIQN